MKIIVGGSMGFKKTGKPYENIDSMTYFSVEKDVPEVTAEEVTALNEKVNKILAEEATKKMIVAYKTYRDKISKLETLLDSGE